MGNICKPELRSPGDPGTLSISLSDSVPCCSPGLISLFRFALWSVAPTPRPNRSRIAWRSSSRSSGDMFATIFSFSRLTSSRHFDSSDGAGGGMFRDLGRSGVTTGGWLGRSLSGVDFFDRSLDRANALFVLCSTGGNPVFGAGNLDDKVVDPGVLSRTDPTI